MIDRDTFASMWEEHQRRYFASSTPAARAMERARRLERIDYIERRAAYDQLRTLAVTCDAPYETKLGMLKMAGEIQPWVTLSHGPAPEYLADQHADRIALERITVDVLDSLAHA